MPELHLVGVLYIIAIVVLGGVLLLITFFTSLTLAEELFKKGTTVQSPCAATDGRYHRNFFRPRKRKSIQEYLGLLITRVLFRTCGKRRKSVIVLSTEIMAVI